MSTGTIFTTVGIVGVRLGWLVTMVPVLHERNGSVKLVRVQRSLGWVWGSIPLNHGGEQGDGPRREVRALSRSRRGGTGRDAMPALPRSSERSGLLIPPNALVPALPYWLGVERGHISMRQPTPPHPDPSDTAHRAEPSRTDSPAHPEPTHPDKPCLSYPTRSDDPRLTRTFRPVPT